MRNTKREELRALQSGVVAFGELMLWPTTRDHERFVQARDFDARRTEGSRSPARSCIRRARAAGGV